MRCWYELGDMDHPHNVDDYCQLTKESVQMCKAIMPLLARKFPAVTTQGEEYVNTQAELLITALLAEHYCHQFDGSYLSTFLTYAQAILPRLTNSYLLCYLLVLLFFIDESPTKAMKRRIDKIMLMWTAKDMTLEDRHLKNLYNAKLETLRFLGQDI